MMPEYYAVEGQTDLSVSENWKTPEELYYDDDGNLVVNDPVGSLKTSPLALLYDAENIQEKTFLTILLWGVTGMERGIKTGPLG